MRRSHLEARSDYTTAPMQSVADLDEQKPEVKPALIRCRVLDEGLPTKRSSGDSWSQMTNGQWLRVVRDQRINLDKRIYRVELYDANRVERLAIFRRSTEAVRR